MRRGQKSALEDCNEELRDLLEDLLGRIQEVREEFTSALDDLEDMITQL